MKNSLTVSIDLGGSSGKMAAATYDQKRIHVQKILNFENPAESDDEGYKVKVNTAGLFNSIKQGLRDFSRMGTIESMGIDTWGGSYAYLDSTGKNIGDIYNDRDKRTTDSYRITCEIMSEWEVFQQSGGTNSRSTILSQIHSDHLINNDLLSNVHSMLLMPSFFSLSLYKNIVV